MRTIVAFLFALVIAAQTPASRIASLEKRLASKPEDADLHFQILQALTIPDSGITKTQVIEKRRLHILWLIQVHPEGRSFMPGSAVIPPRGPFGDPKGYAEAAQLWKDAVAKPGASTEVIANAAIYFKAFDRGFGRDLLDRAMREHPDDPALNRASGNLDAATMAGVSGLNERGQFVTSGALRALPEAETARKEIEASKNPQLLGSAGSTLAPPSLFEIPFGVTFGDDDALVLAERWLRRAMALGPPGDEWKDILGRVLQDQGFRAEGPSEKLRLFREAMSFTDPKARPRGLLDIAKAEFELGDDAAAERDTNKMIDVVADLPKQNIAYLQHGAIVMLGRLALARGNKMEAKERLLASLRVPENGSLRFTGLDLTLAQDLVDVGEREVVLQFLEQSRAVWKYDRGRIDHLVNVVKKSRTPDLLAPFFPGQRGAAAAPFQLADGGGKQWTLKELAGKPVAIEFFRLECERCVSETFPELDKASREFVAGGGVVVAVQVGATMATRKLPMPVLLDTDGAVARRYEVETSPSLIVIGKDGNIAGNYPGFGPEGSIAQNLRQGLNGGSGARPLDAPVQIGPTLGAAVTARAKAELRWEAVDNAESYVVEWDTRDEKGWVGDRDSFFRVVPTRETGVVLEVPEATGIRWRVYAVPRFGTRGKSSEWREFRVKK